MTEVGRIQNAMGQRASKNTTRITKNNNSIFQTEEELVRVIIKSGEYQSKGLTRRQLNVLSEFECSVGRADVIFFLLKKQWRKHLGYGHLPARWVYALKVLPFRKRFSLDEFVSLSGVSRRTAAQALLRYEQIGYCERAKEKDSWIKMRQPTPVVDKIVAVEAKLADWKRAMSQAYRYLRYANQTWVVLDASKANGAIHAKKEFQRLNVGLKVLTRRGEAKTYVRPRLLPAKSQLHFWEANGVIAASLIRLTNP
jgi:hypothetical protein